MHPDLARRLFRLALNEKVAFVPASAEATGPGGQPVPAGAPPAGDPNAAPGAAPMDPQGAPPAGGPAGAPPAPPQDPSMAGGAPAGAPPEGAPAVDPSADPAMAAAAAGGDPGAAPMDPGMDPGMAPPEGDPAAAMGGPDGAPKDDAMVPVSAVVGIIEAMKGRRTAEAEVKAEKAKGGAGDLPPEAAAGPITGLPMGGAPGIQGPLKMASVLKRAMGLPAPGSTPPAPAAPGAKPIAPVQPAMSAGTPPAAGQPQGTLTSQVLARAQAQKTQLAPQLAGAQLPSQHPT